MGNGTREMTVSIRIQTQLDNAKQTIDSLRKELNTFKIPKEAAGEFSREFHGIEKDIEQLQRKTASGEINLIDATAADKAVADIEKRIGVLKEKAGQKGLFGDGLKLDAQAMEALEAIQSRYNKKMESAEATRARMAREVENAKRAEEELLQAQQSQEVVSEEELERKKEAVRVAEQEVEKAKQAREEAEKALKLKIEQSKGKYTEGDIGKKGSNLRKTKAYSDFSKKEAEYQAAQAAMQKASQEAANVTTGSQQAQQLEQIEQAKLATQQATQELERYTAESYEASKIDAFEKAKLSAKELEAFKNTDWDKLGIDMSEIKSVEDLEKAMERLSQEAQGRTKQSLDAVEKELDSASKQFNTMGREVKGAKDDLTQFNYQQQQVASFEQTIARFIGLAGAVEFFRRAVRSAFEATKELDAQMTEMAVVTDLGISDYWDQLPEHTERANALGVAIKDVYEAETLYYQQGLKVNQVVGMSTETLKMAKIAGLSAKDATDKMTAALRGFNMELNETSAQRINDVFSKLAAITAADTNEISEAMTKTASIASAAGMEFETTAAFLAQIIETTRESAETAGTAMKTVIARFSEVKELTSKGLTSGQDSEGEAIDVNKIQTALRSVGISMDEFFNGTEGLDEVFVKLAERWDTLDVKTQRYIATVAAGSRQQSRFIAMMSDYSRTQELVSAANSSAGASNEQYEKTLDSIDTALARLKNAWNQFTMGILENDLVKFGINALTTLLEIINKATSAFGGMHGAIVKVITTISMFKIGQKIFTKIRQPLMNFLTSIVSEVYQKAKETGSALAEGTRDGAQEAAQKSDVKSSTESDRQKYLPGNANTQTKQANQKPGFSLMRNQLFGEKRQEDKKLYGKFKEMKTTQSKQEREDTYFAKKKQLEDMEQNDADKRTKAYKTAKKELKEAEDSLIEYNKTEEEVRKASAEGWNSIGQSMQKIGGTIMGIGMGMSMLGGIFSQLGLPEVGEKISTIGNALMMVGGLISVLGTIIPVVAKIATAAGISVQAAWWPLLLITLAIAAAVFIVVAAFSAFKQYQAGKYENRVKEAKKEAEEAKQAAEEAQQAYDELLSAKAGYDDLQKQLDDLVKGTDEWKEALRKSNEEVIKLLQTYPELAKYIEKGEFGELEISSAGWDAIIKKQEQGVRNAQGAAMSKQLQLDALREEGTTDKDYTDNTTLTRTHYTEGGSYTVTDEAASKQLREDLEQIYIVAGKSLDDIDGKAEELAKKYNDMGLDPVSVDQIKEAAEGLAKSAEEIKAIREDSEATARAYLTTMATEATTNSEFGDAAIDAFANSVNSEATQKAIDNQIAQLDNTKDFKDSEEFSRLAKEYEVNDQMTGDDLQDVKVLYAAMKGLSSIEDIPEGIADSEEKMIKEIATMDQNNKLVKGMEDYTNKLEAIATKIGEDGGKETANNIAGLLSDEGQGMTREFANSFMEGDTFNRGKVDEQAKKLGYNDVNEWAEAVGKTTEELYDEIEENVRSSITINEDLFSDLNRVLKKTGEEGSKRITKFGKDVSIATKNEALLSEKIINGVQLAGAGAGNELKNLLDNALGSAGEDANRFAEILGSMNWNSAEDWEELPEILDNMNISYGADSLKALVDEVKNLGLVIDTVNFDTLTNELQKTSELIKKIQSGEQGRTFDEDSYKLLIASNKNLESSFVKIGDDFRYVGGSINDLTEALKKNAAVEAQKAANQLESQLQVSNAAQKLEESGGAEYNGKRLKLTDGAYTEWSRAEQMAYLEKFRATAIEDGVDTLSYVTNESGESLGLSLGINFSDLNNKQLTEALKGIAKLESSNEQLSTETAKAVSDAKIASYVLNDASQNINKAKELRESGKEASADEYSKALSIQAADSGMVAEAVIAEYNNLISKDFAKMTDEEKNSLSTLDKTMQDSIDRNTEKIEDLKVINEMTNRVADALYDTRQNEIDKLSNINDSINEANEKLVNKIQEQLDYERQQRENEKMEQEIADDQSRLAYLMADTSGAGALEATALQKDITEKQENYEDNLIDQSLQKLSDDNAAAAEQRERQITLMEAQLEHSRESGQLAREAEQIAYDSLEQINAGVNPLETEMYDILAEAESINGGMATTDAVEAFQSDFTQEAITAANSLSSIQDKTGEGAEEQFETKDVLKKLDSFVREAKANDDTKKAAVNMASSLVGNLQTTVGLKDNQKYKQYLKQYTDAGGKASDFESEVKTLAGTITKGRLPKTSFSMSGNGSFAGSYDQDIVVTIDGVEYSGLEYFGKSRSDASTSGQDAKAFGGSQVDTALGNPSTYDGQIGVYNGVPYFAVGGAWRTLFNDSKNEADSSLAEAIKKKLSAFETGGLADFTGPAWLDGTKSKPEMVLNQKDTANFIQLKDILSEVLGNTKGLSKENQDTDGDNYFDININVEKLDSDYDVEQLANKIRQMIYDDAQYRNVNSINLIR